MLKFAYSFVHLSSQYIRHANVVGKPKRKITTSKCGECSRFIHIESLAENLYTMSAFNVQRVLDGVQRSRRLNVINFRLGLE